MWVAENRFPILQRNIGGQGFELGVACCANLRNLRPAAAVPPCSSCGGVQLGSGGAVPQQRL